jgi:serine/threonine protein kinase
MNTRRTDSDAVISSKAPGATKRLGDGSIISSDLSSAGTSLSGNIQLNNQNYTILRQIARSGEAEVYSMEQDGKKFAFKYYYPQYKPKDAILKKLKGLTHPDIIALIDHGIYAGRFFEISEFAEGGSLAEIIPVNTFRKIKEIVTETAEAMNYCHGHGIIATSNQKIFFTGPRTRKILPSVTSELPPM